ncbi:MAG: DUF5615 family PIN-like protein [Dehalococcoidia bacterium]
MKLLCDEGVERQIVEALRASGHAVTYVAEMSPGVSDDDVLELATEEQALLVTSDKDFGELVFRQGRTHFGVVLLRLHGLDPSQKGAVTSAVVAEHGEKLVSAFSVVEHRQVRIRRDPLK